MTPHPPLIKLQIGEKLVREGLINRGQLQQALDEQKRSGRKLGWCLSHLGLLDKQRFLTFLSQHLHIPLVDLRHFPMDPEIVSLLPEAAARRFQAIALARQGDAILVGMTDPTDIFVFDEIARLLNQTPRIALLRESQLSRVLDLAYRGADRMREQVAVLDEEVGGTGFDLADMAQSEMAVDAPVVKILQSLFEDALRMNASDIHIEPDADVLRIRQRIDGQLHEQIIREIRIAPALISKLKLMAGLEIAEKRLPQDGRFNITIKGRNVDVRLSTLPIQDGESVVLRLLDHSAGLLDLEKVGIDPAILDRFRRLILRPHGLILVTGPTGSGKTTTLYGALNALNQPHRKIITVEDPVEYRLPRINQVQVHPRIGLTFANLLRNILRQDPDVVLVGEMRDRETAEIGIRAALTGHLVFSTLHTNGAAEAAIRMVEMGLEGYAVAAALRCIVAQRLIRRICTHCAAPHQPEQHETTLLSALPVGRDNGADRLRRGRGCHHCNHTGFLGRIAVVELLEMDGPLADALRHNDTTTFLNLSKQQPGFIPLHQVALAFALQGITTLEEAMQLHEEPAKRPLPATTAD